MNTAEKPAAESAAGLMVGSHPPALTWTHFPTTQQAVVWRNWELVPVARLAALLETSAENVLALAQGMGLRVPPRVVPEWLPRGYVTLIRANWHLLNYDQLLQLLDWSAEKLAYTLREDDFLWIKLGQLKPKAPRVTYRPLNADEQRRTAALRAVVEREFPDLQQADGEPPFGFLKAFEAPPPRAVAKAPTAVADSPFGLRLIYSYSALYGDPLLSPELDPFPDGLLARLAEIGVNGVWLQGLLYTLYPWAAAPEYTEGWETRLRNLRALAQRAARFGIGVYLYLNEPRGMPLSFYDQHPDWKGVEFPSLGVAALCTSQPAVLDYLRQSTAWVFKQVPELAGVLTISMSENTTSCYSRSSAPSCPRCAKRTAPEVVAEVNRAIAEGVHSAKPEARVLVWTWAWAQEWASQAVDLLPTDVELMCVSEEALPTHVGGVDAQVIDYSISQVGPGPKALPLWEQARRRGLKTVAKVQLNTTWECSAVPWLPAFDLVEEHLRNLAAAKVDGLMLSWTVGGYPSPILELLVRPADEVIRARFGIAAAPRLRAACHQFSVAFKEFPFHISVLYTAPQNCGPRNLLAAEPTGYPATMVGFPYDDLAAWRAVYPEEVFEQQFRRLSDLWLEGLVSLRACADAIEPERRAGFADLERLASAAWCHFRSTYCQIAFVRRRQQTDAESRRQLRALLDEEIAVARQLHDICRQDSRIGFEATNHYAYTLNDLREKVLNCDELRHRYADGG
jgi:hypothetical protein